MRRMNAIGAAIKEYRIRLGISQRELALQIGISQPHVGHYESGEASPGAPTLRRIALALGWSPKQIGELVLGTKGRTLKKVA